MKLIELQDKLGEMIDLLTNKELSYRQRKEHADIAMTVCSLAKQTINNADVVLRAEKLVSEGKLKDSEIIKLIK